jgi:hypothetical protein
MAAAALVVAGVAISAAIGGLTRWACTSGEEAGGSFEADMCNAYAGSFGPSWWLAVIWPAIALGVSQSVPALRRRSVAVAACLAGAGVLVWAATALVVVDVG